MQSLDHIGLIVKDFKKSMDFYASSLAPLGLKIIGQGDGWAMLGKNKCDFWFGQIEGETITTPMHFAFSAKNKEEVQKFYDEAMKHGGIDNGAPDYVIEYGPGYYAAFVKDPDGHNFEAVFRE